ncbi:MAG: PD-(D/E)XK nuclease family protein [Bacteroidales bacterium]|jgi:CRISPR/Cas system-associated exonuclease Cas4 (RecB family)|nr:PD-(D/E)XK nuclease family protein [Bacteroidales bacterium]
MQETTTFLQEVSKEILSGFEDFRKVEIIVPNRRTGLFLKKTIMDSVGKTIWMPKITTIQEIFTSNSNLHQAEELLLIHQLYTVFKKYTATHESFDDFYYWGEVILNDFDDIDKYLVDAEKLFSTIKDIKEIDRKFDGYDDDELEIIKRFWTNINQANISYQKERFLSLWEKMYDIYTEFRQILINKGIAYQGLIYRMIADNPDNCKFDKPVYLIVGFNALNKCEKTIFKWLKSNKETMFFWDADKYYLKDEYQEAGRFLRENIRKYEPFKNTGIINKINKEQKNIEIITAPSPVSQVKIIPQILEKWKSQPDFNPEKTAIILGDENLLIPLMYSIPLYIDPYNISMGFPVKNSAAFAFITHLISLQRNAQTNNKTTRFYFKDILSIINHNFIKSLFPQDTTFLENIINDNKDIYLETNQLDLNEFLGKIFSGKFLNIREISAYMSDICLELINILAGNDELIIELEFLNKISNRVTILHECLITGEIEIIKPDIYFRLMNNSLKNLTVAFEGEPLQGLQVLGFLETRCLDFDRVIMLSINEGIFPKNSASQSLIPYNLRKFYELPSIEFQDSIFAYYFYRIIQRAKEIKIIYSSQAGDTPSEASRFISQVKYEFDKTKNFITFRNDGYKININTRHVTYSAKTVEKITKIKAHLENGISPKAINEYLNCKFRYYLNYIENIKEPDKIEEQEDGAFFGKLFHRIIQDLYEPYTGKVLNEKDLEKIMDSENVKKHTFYSLKKVFNLKTEQDVKRYCNKLIVDIVIKYIYQLLEFDRKTLPVTILGLEKENEVQLFTEFSGTKQNVKIKGFIDRVDFQDGKLRVLDYKTGRTEIKINNIENLFMPDRNSRYDTVTQVLLYTLMVGDDRYSEICPGILNVNELNSGYDYRISIGRNRLNYLNNEMKEEFIGYLENMFSEMLDPEISFTQTKNTDNCKFCPYNIICARN